MSEPHGVYQSKRRDSRVKEIQERRKSQLNDNESLLEDAKKQIGSRTSVNKINENNNGVSNPDVPKDLFTESPKEKKTDSQHSFASSLCLSCCATKQLAIKKNRKSYIAVILRELCIYILYLVVLSLVAFSMISNNNYYFSKVISDEFLDVAIKDSDDRTFKTTVNIDDFWNYLENVLPDALEKFVPSNEKDNELKGTSRLIQLRVKQTPCPASKKYSSTVRKCYPEYSQGNIETRTFIKNKTICPGMACTYTKDHSFRSPHWGTLSFYSDGGGYMVDLSHDIENNTELIKKLKKMRWVGLATRAVFLDFTMHNHNLNLFCVAEIIWEFPPTGGVVTHSALRPISHSALRPLDFVDAYDYFTFACEILFLLFTIYYTLQEILEIKSMGFGEYLKDPWSYLDGTILILSYCCVGIFIYQVTLISEDELMSPKDNVYHAHYDELVFWATQNDNLIGICLFLAWSKIFKYISFNRTMNQLSSTLSRCAKDIAGFALMFFIVFFSFAQLGYLLFGPQIFEFSTFGESICTLLRLILGDFDYRKLETANRILGPMFFVSYIFFVFFVLLVKNY